MKNVGLLRSAAATFALSLSMLVTPAISATASFSEPPDAGDSLATAFNAQHGLGRTLISGSLSNEPALLDWVDMFKFSTAHPLLIASTGSGIDTNLIADPVLYLFDSTGKGVAMDDESGGSGQAFLNLLGQLSDSIHFLAIAFGGVEPLDSAGNSIFDVFGDGSVKSGGALASWGGTPLALNPAIEGRYSIAVSNVPLPGSIWLSVAALLLLARTQRAGRVQARAA